MKIYICGGSAGHVQTNFECLDLRDNTWKTLTNMNVKREEHGFTLGSDGKLYAIGGFNGKQCLKLVERYNESSEKWEEVAPLQYARRSLCAVCLKDGIYAIGGYNGEKYLNVVEKYNIEKNVWTTVKSLNHARCTMGCVCTSDRNFIYILGGYDGVPLNSVERYDVANNKWEFIASMRRKRFMHATVIISIDN